MKYHITTYGCQMNHSDSEKIAAILKGSGHRPARDESEADLIVVNSCSVRQAAMHRVYDKIEKFYRGKKVIIAGCVLPADKEKYQSKVEFWHPDDYFDRIPLAASQFRAYIPIMTGCDNFCSYCAVPYTRGREKSRPAAEIIKEIRSLVKKGYKEIILLGQNVNSYKSPENGTKFYSLLKQINTIPGDFWLNFISSHPKDMSDELIQTIAQCEKITPYIHLPVQSGDNLILRKMNRHYTVAHYKALIKKLRAAFKKSRPAFPPLAVSTDIIVGFPTETKKQFQNTARLARNIGFDMIYFAQYSPRPGTAAATMPDDVPQAEKKKRAQKLNEILKQTAQKNNRKYIGQKIEVLIEEINDKFAIGKTSTFKTVRLAAKKLKPGDIVTIKVTKATAWGLTGG